MTGADPLDPVPGTGKPPPAAMIDLAALRVEHAPALGGGTVLDAGTVQSLQELGGEDDPELLLELIDLFLEDAQERMDGLHRAMEQGDVEQAGKYAHALKSASANLGAMTFSSACRELEQHARQGQLDLVRPVAESAGALFLEVRATLEALRQELS